MHTVLEPAMSKVHIFLVPCTRSTSSSGAIVLDYAFVVKPSCFVHGIMIFNLNDKVNAFLVCPAKGTQILDITRTGALSVSQASRRLLRIHELHDRVGSSRSEPYLDFLAEHIGR